MPKFRKRKPKPTPAIVPNRAVGADTRERLVGLVKRIENIDGEIASFKVDRRAVVKEAKAAGFDAAIINEMIRERAKDRTLFDEREALKDQYRHALGMLAETPLGQAAIAKADKAAGDGAAAP